VAEYDRLSMEAVGPEALKRALNMFSLSRPLDVLTRLSCKYRVTSHRGEGISVAPAIQAERLCKAFGPRQVLHDLTFNIPAGGVSAFLGPNGAGKTTCLRILATTLRPSSGRVQVLGHQLGRGNERIRNEIAVVPQEALTDMDLTGWESVYGYLLARGQGGSAARAAAEEALKLVSLWADRHRLTGTYSGGMKRRVLIAMALATRAKLLFLDEPTTGLDPVAKREIWSALHSLHGERTVLLTTHLMDEVEALADQVLVLADGRLRAVGTTEELRAFAPWREKVLIDKQVPRARLTPFGRVQDEGNQWALFVDRAEAIHQVVDLTLAAGKAVSIRPATLEDAYLSLLETARDQAGTAHVQRRSHG
jgi:ABC-2 type transport system ATP-binding protein